MVLPEKTSVSIVYSTTLINSEGGTDSVAQQFRKAGVDILLCVPDTWAFPQLTTISLLNQLLLNKNLWHKTTQVVAYSGVSVAELYKKDIRFLKKSVTFQKKKKVAT